jgi:hypothetical protein
MDRDSEEKTSAVHFLRFELTEKMVADLQQGASLGIGIDHSHYAYEVEPVAEQVRVSLLADLD